jgi:acyl carrier protein
LSTAGSNLVEAGRRASVAPNGGASNDNLSNGSVLAVVRRMLVERSLDDTVTADADLRDVGLTSLDMVELVLSVECAFDLQIPEAQITPANFRSIATIDTLINTLRG